VLKRLKYEGFLTDVNWGFLDCIVINEKQVNSQRTSRSDFLGMEASDVSPENSANNQGSRKIARWGSRP